MSDSKFWLNRAIDHIETAHPEGEVVLESGFGPSGIFHLGHLREILTVDALRWGLEQRGRQAKHILFIDDFDALRKVPVNVDSSFEQYLGMPVYLVPSPDGSNKNYAEHFFSEFFEAIKAQGVETEVLWAHEQYQAGKFTDHITRTLQNNDRVHDIIESVSHRQLKRDWVPIQILSDNNRLDEWSFKSFDSDKQTVSYIDNNGQEGEISYADGRVKLNWRIDWPARWAIWGVQVEPFGRDHATKGGSYDTGKAIIEEIFDTPAPLP
ncbi:MAG: lysine--tRNA ligase, partial [Candidatus Saccharimonadales bacterium]|nr:lysine--tRNA ligase [Candidatus Saccharimonadales bacterium]